MVNDVFSNPQIYLKNDELTLAIELKEMLEYNKKITILLQYDKKIVQKIILKRRKDEDNGRIKTNTRGRY